MTSAKLLEHYTMKAKERREAFRKNKLIDKTEEQLLYLLENKRSKSNRVG